MNVNILSNQQNKVFEEIQPPSGDLQKEYVSKVLYANSASGTTPVDMPDDLKELLNSDLGLSGNNVLIQLKNKMSYYAGGPWYVDCIDGVIHIHNRKFSQRVDNTYIYQAENGEVLSVTFRTQYTIKNSKVELNPEIDPITKSVHVPVTQILGGEPLKMDPMSNPDVHTDALYVANPRMANGWMKDGWFVSPGFNYKKNEGPLTPLNSRQINKIQGKDKELRDPELQQSLYRDAENQFLSSMTLPELNSMIETNMSGQPSDIQNAMRILIKNMKNTKDSKAYGEALNKILEGCKVQLTSSKTKLVPVEEVIDLKTYGSPSKMDASNIQHSKLDKLDYNMTLGNCRRAYSQINSDPNITILEEYGKENFSRETNPPPTRVRVIRWKTIKEIPLVKIYGELFSRYGGLNKVVWAANANANGGIKRKERVLICNMRVVGNPSLQSSQVINILNVGSKWSGQWYIQNISHKMDAGQGYICEMELVKNIQKAGSNTTKVSFNPTETVANISKVEAKTEWGKKAFEMPPEKDITLDFTYNEVEYFNARFLNPDGSIKGGNVTRPFFEKGIREFVANKVAYNTLNADNPIAIARGTVISHGNVVDEQGNLIKSNVDLIQVKNLIVSPSKVKYDIMDISKRLYELNKKLKGK